MSLSVILLPAGNTYAFSLKPPKTNIGIIDNNRDLIDGAAKGTIALPIVGTLVGAWWGDHQAAQDKIDALKAENRQLEAEQAESKLDIEQQRSNFEATTKSQLNANDCLKVNAQAYTLAMDGINNALATFNRCLELASDSNSGQACLDSYESRVNDLANIAKLLSKCN